jgi:hypothetical protein
MTTSDRDLPEPLAAACASMQRRWALALLTPVAYAIVATLMRARHWLDRPSLVERWDGPLGWSFLGSVGAALIAGLALGRHRQRAHILRLAGEPEVALRRWIVDFHVLAALADALAFLGLLACALTGRSWPLLAGGALAYLGYAVARPRRSDLAGLRFPPGFDVDFHA